VKDGNIDLDSEIQDTFEVGDPVRLKNKIVRDPAHKLMGPRLLMKIGWPNLFYVERTGATSEGESGVILSACCFNLGDGKGGHRCKGHPASFFEKIKPEVEGEDRPRKPGDRTASVTTPLGDILNAKYLDDADNPGLIINLFGKKFRANGAWVKQVADLAKEKGLL